MSAAPVVENVAVDTQVLAQVQAQENVGVVGVARDPEAIHTVLQIQGIISIQDTPQPHTALPPPPLVPKDIQDQEEVDDDDDDDDDHQTESHSESDSDNQQQETPDEEEATSYWHVHDMAPLNARSAAAVARLRAYKPPPFPLWDRLPLSRRAAVLLLLYADRRGDLRVVITMRAASLRSFSGHAALPGGKADSLDESPYQIARREAYEEIGLPMDDSKLPPPFRIEHLCYLPMSLARTELVVRPCVALLHTGDGVPSPRRVPSSSASSSSSSSQPASSSSSSPAPPPASKEAAPQSPPAPTKGSSPPPSSSASSSQQQTPATEPSLMPRLDAKEVAAVFSAPFHNFLKAEDEPPAGGRPLPPGKWYEGSWTTWNDTPWRMHFFYVPVNNQRVVKPAKALTTGTCAASLPPNGSETTTPETPENNNNETRYKVWGMTARILVDAATIAYGHPPEFEHNNHFGDEEMIEALAKIGRLGEKKRPGSTLTAEDVKRAKEVMEEERQRRASSKEGRGESKM